MNWMICYDYGKESHHVFSDMINNKDNAIDAIQAYQEKYDDNEIRIVAVIPVASEVFEDYYVSDNEKFDRGQNSIRKMRNAIAYSVASYENR